MLFCLLLLATANSYKLLNVNPSFAVRYDRRSALLAKTDNVNVVVRSTSSDAAEPLFAIDSTSGQNVLKVGSGAAINTLIINTLEDRGKSPKERLKRLKAVVQDKGSLLNHVHAATMLQRCARFKLDITEAISLDTIGGILGKASHRKNLRSVEAAHAMYGLRVLNEETPDMSYYLNQLTQLISDCEEPFKAQEIGNALYGLQRFTCDKIEVRKLLAVFGAKLKTSTVQLSAQEISNSIYGLRKMNSESEEVLAILEFLTRKTVECKDVFNCMCVGNCLNGLQGMSSDNKIVLELLRALVLKVAKSPEELTSITIGSALMGVRRMDTVTAEVRTLLAILALKINDSKTVLDPISFSMAFNGLRCMDESSVEMRALLGTLADKADVMPHETLTPSILSNAMSGLRRIKGECYESRQVVTAILKKLGGPSEVSTGDAEASNARTWKHISIGQFNSLDIGRSLYGLQSMSPESCPEVRPLLERLALSIRSSKGPLYARDAGLALYGLRSHTEQSAESTAIVGGIAERLALSKDSFNAKSASMAMMGVQGLSSDSAAVCDLLTVIKDRVGPFDSQACGNILYSMRKMSSDKAEVRSFLASITPKMEQCTQPMTAQELANAFYGLQGMDSTHAETRNALRVLTQKLMESKDTSFTSQGIGNALSGFQSMALVDGPQVAVALGYLTDRLEACPDVMTPLDISNALYGLQGMTSDSMEVRVLLTVLIAKMRQSEGVYTGRDIGYSLVGLSGMQPAMHDEVHEIFEELCVKVSRSEFQGQPNLLFMQFGKGVRVKRGNSKLTLDNAKDVVARKSRKEREKVVKNE